MPLDKTHVGKRGIYRTGEGGFILGTLEELSQSGGWAVIDGRPYAAKQAELVEVMPKPGKGHAVPITPAPKPPVPTAPAKPAPKVQTATNETLALANNAGKTAADRVTTPAKEEEPKGMVAEKPTPPAGN